MHRARWIYSVNERAGDDDDDVIEQGRDSKEGE